MIPSLLNRLGNINGNYGPVVEPFKSVAACKSSEKIHAYVLCLKRLNSNDSEKQHIRGCAFPFSKPLLLPFLVYTSFLFHWVIGILRVICVAGAWYFAVSCIHHYCCTGGICILLNWGDTRAYNRLPLTYLTCPLSLVSSKLFPEVWLTFSYFSWFSEGTNCNSCLTSEQLLSARRRILNLLLLRKRISQVLFRNRRCSDLLRGSGTPWSLERLIHCMCGAESLKNIWTLNSKETVDAFHLLG